MLKTAQNKVLSEKISIIRILKRTLFTVSFLFVYCVKYCVENYKKISILKMLCKNTV